MHRSSSGCGEASRLLIGLVGLFTLCALCACGPAETASEGLDITADPVAGIGGSAGMAGAAGAAGATTGGAGGAGAGGASGAAGTAGVGGAGSGGAGGAGSGGASGSGGAGGMMIDDSIPLVACESASKEACSSFTTPEGVVLELGPYGGIMEPNVGQGFEVPIAANDNNASCQGFVNLFSQDAEQSARLLDLTNTDLELYTVYRPARWVEGEKYPLLTWGNGTCAQPEGYGALLRYVASHGFIVVAANSRQIGTTGGMVKALDFMFAANDDPSSPYHQRIDTTHVGAMGHSQGGMATVTAALDARIQVVILFNGGTTADKPFLAISGDRDVFTTAAGQLATPVSRAPKAAYMFFHMIPMSGSFDGHLTLMLQPERLTEATVGWFKYMLLGDTVSRDLFVGDSCGLCNHDADFEYGQNGLQ